MSTPADSSPAPAPQGALYRAVWRWHFFAGVLVAPFALFLAVTGATYVWKPQYEEWRYRALVTVPPTDTAIPVEEQFAAALSRHPGAQPVTFTPAFSAGRSSELIVRVISPDAPANLPAWQGERTSVFVDPHTGAVTGEVVETERLMHTVMKLHSELLSGKRGSFLIELAASWMFVLLLTGFYLWWPRPFQLRGFLWPRFDEGRRTLLRDLHAVPAVWCSAAALFLLASGLPWTEYGGRWFRTVSAAIGEGSPRESNAGAHRSELVGWSPPLRVGLAPEIDALASAMHDHGGSSAPPADVLPPGMELPARISLDQVMAIADAHGVPRPYSLALPVGPTGVLSVMTDRTRVFGRVQLHLDQYTGRILADVRYGDYGLMGKFFLVGMIGHEGQLFGLANQILSTLAAGGVFLMAASGLFLWWQRRPPGAIAAPPKGSSLPRPVVLGVLILACFLPLLAATLVGLLAADRLLILARGGRRAHTPP